MFSSKPKDTIPAGASRCSPRRARPNADRSASAPSIISADLIGQRHAGLVRRYPDGRPRRRRRAPRRPGDRRQGRNPWRSMAEESPCAARVRAASAPARCCCATSHVEGDILHEAFAVESGAFFEGNCRHSDNPLGDEPQPTKPPRRHAARRRARVARRVRHRFAPQPADVRARRSRRRVRHSARDLFQVLDLFSSACRRLPGPAPRP